MSSGLTFPLSSRRAGGLYAVHKKPLYRSVASLNLPLAIYSALE